MYSTGTKANNSQNLKLTNSFKSNKNDVQQPPIQIRSKSAAPAKILEPQGTSKATAFKTKPSQIPFINNRGNRPMPSSRESSSLKAQDIKPQKLSRGSSNIDAMPGNINVKRDSRKDIYSSFNSLKQNKKSVSNLLVRRIPLRSKTSPAKAPPYIRSLSATTSIPMRKPNISSTNMNFSKNNVNKDSIKSERPKKSATTSASNCQCQRNIKNSVSESLNISNEEFLSPFEINEMAIQTNESEILNHSLIVGDLKIMKPSKNLVEEIERLRHQTKTQKLLKARRKFADHSARDEEHLNEFLEKSYVSKKPAKVQGHLLEDDLKLIASMDKLFSRQIPKTESIKDIRARFKRKEEELLSLYDKVPNVLSNKN